MDNNYKLSWHIASDESGIDGQVYYGFGSLWMKYQRRGDFARDIRELKEKHNHNEEIKWQKVNSKRYSAFYDELVDYFFKNPAFAFHCIIVRKGYIDPTYHNGDYNIAMQKHFTDLIANKIISVVEKHPNRECEFRIDVDPLPFNGKKSDEKFNVIANRMINKKIGKKNLIKSVLVKDSKSSFNIQIADLFLGAVMSAYQNKATAERKLDLMKLVASYIGWDNLRHDTYNSERKFNIWYFYDKTENIPREIVTLPVKLKYPLPEQHK